MYLGCCYVYIWMLQNSNICPEQHPLSRLLECTSASAWQSRQLVAVKCSLDFDNRRSTHLSTKYASLQQPKTSRDPTSTAVREAELCAHCLQALEAAEEEASAAEAAAQLLSEDGKEAPEPEAAAEAALVPENMTVAALQEELSKRGLDTKWNPLKKKKELVDRLQVLLQAYGKPPPVSRAHRQTQATFLHTLSLRVPASRALWCMMAIHRLVGCAAHTDHALVLRLLVSSPAKFPAPLHSVGA